MTPFTLNINGILYDITAPKVMGIINVTPDSFYAPSRVQKDDLLRQTVTQMVADGADILDIGAYSTRPGHKEVSTQEEIDRICQAMEIIRDSIQSQNNERENFEKEERENSEKEEKENKEQILLSVDTFRAQVARVAVEDCGIHIVNDISGGRFDPDMLPTVGLLKVPYILSHLWGTRDDFPKGFHPSDNPAVEVTSDLLKSARECHKKGIIDVIVDPGFGFGKTLKQNYQILANLENLKATSCPILVGLSRKSMITKALDITPEEALPSTALLNAMALERGAAILRVHDVKEARHTIKLYSLIEKNTDKRNNIHLYRHP